MKKLQITSFEPKWIPFWVRLFICNKRVIKAWKLIEEGLGKSSTPLLDSIMNEEGRKL